MSRSPVNRALRGYFLGSLVGLAAFLLLIAPAAEAMNILLAPFFMLFFGGVGALIAPIQFGEQKIVRLKSKESPRATYIDCCYALGVCLLITILLLGITQIISHFS